MEKKKLIFLEVIDPQTARVFGRFCSFWKFLEVFDSFCLAALSILVFWYSIQTGFLFVDMSGFAFWFKTASFWHPEK